MIYQPDHFNVRPQSAPTVLITADKDKVTHWFCSSNASNQHFSSLVFGILVEREIVLLLNRHIHDPCNRTLYQYLIDIRLLVAVWTDVNEKCDVTGGRRDTAARRPFQLLMEFMFAVLLWNCFLLAASCWGQTLTIKWGWTQSPNTVYARQELHWSQT